MSAEVRKISWLAVVLLVVLRISIGWHLFYEGVWKLNTQRTARPWTAEGYLKNSTGPLRTTFRNMTGDPSDLKWLSKDDMSAKWDGWRDRFVAHYGIDQKQIDRLLDGPEGGYVTGLEALPPEFNFEEAVKTAGIAKGAIKYDEKAKRLIVDRKLHLLPTEQVKLIDVVEEAQAAAKAKGADLAPFEKLTKAIEVVGKQASQLGFREQLAAILEGDPERAGINQKAKKDGDPELVVTVGDVEKYKKMVARYENDYAKAKTKYQWDHLERQWGELQALRASLVGPVQALEKDLFEDANKLLSQEQLAHGPVPSAVTEISRINYRTMWGLTVFGLLLMLGLFSRLSALGGAALLTLFYMAMPPWPGVQEIPSIEHNLIVNKIFVEMIALLALAAMPSGRWFGLDAVIAAIFRRKKKA